MSIPRKVDPDQIEVLDAHGAAVREGLHGAGVRGAGVRVMQMGPLGLLVLPIVMVFFVLMVPILAVLALLFGRSMFRVFHWRRGPGWMR
jgi:hypothetical protein